MPILSRDEYFARLHDRLGDDTSDETIAFLEDMTDTYNDLERKATGDGVDWEQKYHDLDESWKKRYRHRFFSGDNTGAPATSTPETVEEEVTGETITVEDLFDEKESD